jgi:hypothetical protein
MGGPGDADPCRCRSRADAELDCPPSSRRARAEQRQRPRRLAEAQARRIAARYADQAAADGLSCPRTADLLHIAPRTLRHWRRTLHTTGLQAKPRGRRMKEVDRTTRNGVLALLQITGPAVGLPALQAIFRDVPRAVLHDLLTRFRRVWRYRQKSPEFCFISGPARYNGRNILDMMKSRRASGSVILARLHIAPNSHWRAQGQTS